jgi:aldehyde:ferredoxin oxidoreductase
MPRRTPDKLLRVDLTAECVKSEAVPKKWLRRYVGGKGLGARYLYEELSPSADPLGSENALLFMLGPLSGVLPGEPRYAVITKSPLTGAFLDSYSGGEFAASLAGALGEHIGMLVTGRADTPVRIKIEDGTATIAPASDLWGADTVEVCASVDAPVACIGLAGEHRVKYATIASDAGEHHAGRGGAGAVMGAKRLKAIVARGNCPDALSLLRKKYADEFRDANVGHWQAASGTLESVDFANEVGVLSTRGWQEGRFEGTDDIGIEAAKAAAYERERDDDAVPGGFRVETDEGKHVPRGANAMSLGAGLGIDEFDSVAVLGETCDRLGVDVISGGSAVAWAIRASQEDIIERDLRFGDPGGARALIKEIARRETPFGDALADGVRVAASSFGGDDLVPTVKAMEVPPYDPRGAKGMALAYATSDRGGCHRRARPVETEVFREEELSDVDRVRRIIAEQNARSILWSLIIDDFVGEVLWSDLGAEWLSAVGHDYTVSELWTVGERIWTLIRLFNVREGFSRSDDAIPTMFTEPLSKGPSDGKALNSGEFEAMLEQYYAERGWSEKGRPTWALLERLDLVDTVDGETPIALHRVRPLDDS